MTSLLCVDPSRSRRVLIGAIAARLGRPFLECESEDAALDLLRGQQEVGALVAAYHDGDGHGIRLIENLRLLPHRVALSAAFVMDERNLALAQRALHAGATEVFLYDELGPLEASLSLWTAPPIAPAVDGHVLLVEDSAADAALIAHLLNVMGLTVRRATNVAGGRELLAAHRFDLAVIDIVLDDTKTGIALLEHVRHDLALALPVLMMSGFSDPSRRLAAIRNGADDFLAKPFAIEEFVWRADRLLRAGAEANAGGVQPTPGNGAGRDANGWGKLTGREVQIAQYLLDGKSDKEIAAHLGISYWTVRSHVQHVFDKLGVINRRELLVRHLRQNQ